MHRRSMTRDLESLLRASVASRRGLALCALGLLGAISLALFVALGAAPIDRLSEARCVDVVKEMVESGEWLVPRLAGVVRLQKPPLFYWAGAVVAEVSGDTGPWSARAVSAAAALALAALVLVWGRSLGGGAVALIAAGSLAAMQQFTSSGRRGDAEMLLALLSAASLFCFDRMHAERRRDLLPVFALLVGLAFLAKATAVLLTVVSPIAVYLALRRELGVLRQPRVLAALALAAAIGVSWYAALLAFVPGAFDSLRDALLLPLGDAQSHGGSTHFRPPWWFLSVLPVRAAPASLLLPLVIWRLWSTRLYREDPRRRFAALAFLVPFVGFSLLPQKQKHYTLGMLTGLALCSADAVVAAARELGPRFALALRALGIPLALAGLAATVVLALFFTWVEELAPLTVAAGAAVPFALFAFAGAAALAARPASFGASWILGFLLALVVGRGIVEARVAVIMRDLVQLPLEQREHIAAVVREHGWFARLLLLDLGPPSSADDD
jgi:4-amino-4-deoxy-L-arabinose transferase-like glycosyltransferase